MKRVTVPSYPVSIFLAGDLDDARRGCREYCDAQGLCVTVTATEYIYTDGQEPGVIVGLINYPRFPKDPRETWDTARDLAIFLMGYLGQKSFSVQAPDKTEWFSIRRDDIADAIAMEAREGGDGETRLHRNDDSAGPQDIAQKETP